MSETETSERWKRPKRTSGLLRIWRAFRYSISGLSAAYRNEAAFRQEAIAAIVLVPLAFVLADEPVRRALMVGAVLLVPIVELLNSAIEAAVDRISADLHPLSKQAKDIGSAAVFLSIVNLIAVWTAILL